MLNRREFLGAAGAVAALAATAARAGGPGGASGYDRALVVDALGGPGDFAAGAPDDAPWSAAAVADARASGITAVNLTVSAVGNAPHRFEETVANIARVDRELERHGDAFVAVRAAKDLVRAKDSRRLGLVYGFQDTSMLEGDLGRLALFAGLGVRIVQATYNRRNLVGDGCLEPADGGLSLLGREFVAALNEQRLLLDLSHAGPRTIADGIAASRAPVTISHTGCRALADLPRNTSDSALRALADKGGVAGIYFMMFLRTSGQPHAADVIRHLEHAVDVAGEDHVGIGTDGAISAMPLDDPAFRAAHRDEVARRVRAGISAPGESPDVFNVIPEYNSPRRLARLADDLAGRGWPGSRIDKVLGGNFARLFAEVWGG